MYSYGAYYIPCAGTQPRAACVLHGTFRAGLPVTPWALQQISRQLHAAQNQLKDITERCMRLHGTDVHVMPDLLHASCRRALLQTPPPKTPTTPPAKTGTTPPTKTAAAPVKTGTAPPQAPPKKAQETGQGRTATTGTKQQQPAGTTGQGARDGLGKFDFLAPDTPGVKSATAGRRYAWGAGGSGLVSIEQRPAGAWQV
jgi:hypothetical protein